MEIDREKEKEKELNEFNLKKLEIERQERDIEVQRQKEERDIEVQRQKEKEDRELNLKKLEVARIEKEKEFILEKLRIETRANRGLGPDRDEDRQGVTETMDAQRMSRLLATNLNKFDENRDDIDAFVNRFERKCELYHVTGEVQAMCFADLLQGRALEAYNLMSIDDAKDFHEIKRILFAKYQVNADGFRKRFESSSMNLNETPKQFLTRIEGYWNRWISMAKIDKTYEAIQNEFVKNKFLNSVSPQLCIYLKERKNASLDEMAMLAENYLEARQLPAVRDNGAAFTARDKFIHSEKRGFQITKPKENFVGNANRFPPNRESNYIRPGSKDDSQVNWRSGMGVCMICNKGRHPASECRFRVNHNVRPTQSSTHHGNNEYKDITCFSCGGKGHTSKVCRNRPHQAALAMVRSQTSVKRISTEKDGDLEADRGILEDGIMVRCRKHDKLNCSECMHDVGREQFMDRACLVGGNPRQRELPWVQGRVNNKTVTAIRDTGCTTVMIRRDLVQEDELTGEFKNCLLADGTLRRCPEAIVNIETPFFSGKTKCLCLKNPVYDILVGNIDGVKSDINMNESCEPVGEPVVETPIETSLDKRVEVLDSSLTDTLCLDVHNNDSEKIVTENVVEFSEMEECNVITRAQAEKEAKGPKPLNVTKINLVTNEDMKKVQLEDESLQKFWSLAKDKVEPVTVKGSTISYVIKKDLLYRVFQNKRHSNGNVFTQMMVPLQYRKQVMELAHSSAFSGHMGRKATEDRVISNFFWPGCFSDVERFCKSCDICQRTTPAGKVKKLPLGKMPYIDVPFKRVAMDLIGPMVKTDRGHQYVLTVIDVATRYPECVALKKIDTVSVADALMSIFARVGIPSDIQSDLGRQFTSDQMKEVCRLLGIKQLFNTPYHPQNTGVIERLNGVLKSMIKKLSYEKITDWDRFLDPAMFAYRSTVQKGTGFSPFELLYGRTVRGPMDILRELWTKEEKSDDLKITYQYVIELREKIEETCKLAAEELGRTAAVNKKYFDKKAKYRSFEPGDKVLLLLSSSSNKLQLAWKGPFVVVQKVNDLDYKIQLANKIRTFHGNMLKKYEERTEECSGIAVVEEPKSMDEIEQGDIPMFNAEQTENHTDVNINEELDSVKRKQVEALVYEFKDIFSDVPGRTNLIEVDIKLERDERLNQHPYPVPFALRDELNKEIDSMLALGIIEPSSAKYASPLVMIKKADGKSYRVCTDFRSVNKLLKFDQEPISNVEEIWSKLHGSQWYSKGDFCKGFWQLPISESSRDITSFLSPKGLFRYCYLPFGLSVSPAWFTRMMRKLLEGCSQIEHFFDDVLAHTSTWEQHLETLRDLFTRVRAANLTLKPSKCFFGYRQIEFLGHTMTGVGLLPVKDKVERILKVPAPQDKKQLLSFLGFIGFYRKFIENYSSLAKPLTDLTRKSVRFKWDREHAQSFEALKQKLSCEPILMWPNVNEEFFIQTDASKDGIGGVLLQLKDGVRHPVLYVSRKLSQCEQNYSTIERELLAIVWVIGKLGNYLYGKRFFLETDHEPLKYLSSSKVSNSRLLRWALILQQYDFTILSVKGKDNVIADCLSRLI